MFTQYAYSAIRNGVITGFAGYGAAVAYGANAALAAKIGAIYGLAISTIPNIVFALAAGGKKRLHSNLSFFAVDAVAIIACRAFNLIGNKGLAILSAVSLARFAIFQYARF